MTKREAKKQAADLAKNWQANGGLLTHYPAANMWVLNHSPVNDKVAKELIERLGLIKIPEISFYERKEGYAPPICYAKPDYALGAMKALQLVYSDCTPLSEKAKKAIKNIYYKIKPKKL